MHLCICICIYVMYVNRFQYIKKILDLPHCELSDQFFSLINLASLRQSFATKRDWFDTS